MGRLVPRDGFAREVEIKRQSGSKVLRAGKSGSYSVDNPKDIQALIFDYYEKLCAMVTANDWSTDFFLFDIGLFQGCVLSTILFDCVFQLLLDFLCPNLRAAWAIHLSQPQPSQHSSKHMLMILR